MEERASTLRTMKICRFCLDEKGPLSKIHETDNKDGKHTVPLPLQIMACVAIEVFKNDGMPQLICDSCRSNTNQAYTFKGTCKRSDDALKLFLSTGNINLLKPSAKVAQTSHHIIKRKPLPAPTEQRSEPKKLKINEESVVEHVTKQTSPTIPELCITNSEDMDEPILEFEIGHDQEEIVETHLEDPDDDEDDDDNDDENDDEEEIYDEDDTINPVLKVPQIQTDVFPCPHCERSFPLKQLLDLHMKNHARERSYACELCDGKFFTKYDLGKHIQTHSRDRPFPCIICKKTFARESLLHRHEKTHVDAPKYLCSYCDRTFLIRSDLDSHIEKHKKKRPYQCRICKKCFVFKQGLERHEVTHSGEKPHKCNYCEASFTSPIKLMRHITSHAGLRPYPCKLCGRTFLLSHHLTRHMRSHYAMKNSDAIGQHKCDICSMSFRRKDSLINHSTIHSMVNLKCVICNTAFENAKQVMNHITTHLSGLPYPCDKCDYSFDTQDQLEEHEIKHAEMEYEELIEKEVSKEVRKDFEKEEEEEEDDEEESDDDITEYTITDAADPQLVRRSKRAVRIKNYAQFLKEELGSDIEDGLLIPEEQEVDEEEPLEITPDIKLEEEDAAQSFKPIVRIEGTKVYTRKNIPERPKQSQLKLPKMSVAPLEEINQKMTTLENLGLTKQDVQALPNKQFVDMKIGDKTVRVQKLMMTKAEIEQMAKEGKIEMKGDTILLKKTVQAPTKSSSTTPVPRQTPFRHTMETIIGDKPPTQQKPLIKKTYVRKTISSTMTAKKVQNDTDQNENPVT